MSITCMDFVTHRSQVCRSAYAAATVYYSKVTTVSDEWSGGESYLSVVSYPELGPYNRQTGVSGCESAW